MSKREAGLRWTSEVMVPESMRPPQRSIRELTADDMDVAFQPIVDLRTGQPFAAEALARCRWRAYQNPVRLFEAAVSEGACGHVGRVVREVAFRREPDIPLFVNVHPDELCARWIVRPDDPLSFHNQPVYLELTEAAALSHYDVCRHALNELRDRTGARLVIDDLGAGYSNLGRIIDLCPSVVKLDRSVVSGIDSNRRQRVMVKHVVAMCNELGAIVVAEGIETAEEMDTVRDLGAQLGQGYLIGRPEARAFGHQSGIVSR